MEIGFYCWANEMKFYVLIFQTRIFYIMIVNFENYEIWLLGKSASAEQCYLCSCLISIFQKFAYYVIYRIRALEHSFKGRISLPLIGTFSVVNFHQL